VYKLQKCLYPRKSLASWHQGNLRTKAYVLEHKPQSCHLWYLKHFDRRMHRDLNTQWKCFSFQHMLQYLSNHPLINLRQKVCRHLGWVDRCPVRVYSWILFLKFLLQGLELVKLSMYISFSNHLKFLIGLLIFVHLHYTRCRFRLYQLSTEQFDPSCLGQCKGIQRWQVTLELRCAQQHKHCCHEHEPLESTF